MCRFCSNVKLCSLVDLFEQQSQHQQKQYRHSSPPPSTVDQQQTSHFTNNELLLTSSQQALTNSVITVIPASSSSIPQQLNNNNNSSAATRKSSQQHTADQQKSSLQALGASSAELLREAIFNADPKILEQFGHALLELSSSNFFVTTSNQNQDQQEEENETTTHKTLNHQQNKHDLDFLIQQIIAPSSSPAAEELPDSSLLSTKPRSHHADEDRFTDKPRTAAVGIAPLELPELLDHYLLLNIDNEHDEVINGNALPPTSSSSPPPSSSSVAAAADVKVLFLFLLKESVIILP